VKIAASDAVHTKWTKLNHTINKHNHSWQNQPGDGNHTIKTICFSTVVVTITNTSVIFCTIFQELLSLHVRPFSAIQPPHIQSFSNILTKVSDS
jgi:hypothetical protein